MAVHSIIIGVGRLSLFPNVIPRVLRSSWRLTVAAAPDAAVLVGVGLITVGIWQWSQALALVVLGALLAAVGVGAGLRRTPS